MQIALMSIGVPGSGKTTALKKIIEAFPAAYICPDDIRAEVSGGDPTDHGHEETVWTLARIRAVQALESGQHVIIDATFTRKSDREEFVELLREAGATHVFGAYAEVPLKIAQERNRARNRTVPEQVMRRKAEALEKDPPSLTEGFDAIVPLSEMEAFLTPGA